MPYVVVDNFSAGLDSRRHVLNSKSGTLSELINAHITRGGEIEKRKAFVEYADLNTLGLDTYGLEATADGLYVFGSAPAPVSMPTGMIYQRLLHPVSPDAYSLSKVVFSTVYGGKPFVIAEFAKPLSGYPSSFTHRIAFYDGVAVKDWYQGYTFLEQNVIDVATSLTSYFPDSGYTAASTLVSGLPVIDVTGPAGKEFSITASVDAPITATITKTQAHKVAILETLSKGSFTVSGGSVTSAYVFRGTRYLDAASLPGIRSIRVGASSATAADGLDLIGWGGATGLKYDTVTPTETTGSNGGSLYWNIRKAINDNTTAGIGHSYSSRWRWAGNWSGNDPNDLWIDAPPSQGSDANGLLVQIEFDSTPAGVGNLSEFIDTSTIAVSPYNASKYIATMGVMANGSFNRVNSVKVDGVEVLGTAVSWETSHGATAAAIAAQINSFTSSTEYTASVTDGSKVQLAGVAGSGKSPNGRVISVVAEGTVVISGITSFSGGTDTVAAVPQISRISLDVSPAGNVPAGKKFGLTIIDPDNPSTPIIFGGSRMTGKNGNFSVTYKAKEYLGSGSTLYFSAVNDATKWDIYDTGSGFIDMSNNFGGREDLTGAGIYQNYMAVFSRRNVQLWGMDADPAQNTQVQVLANTGAIAPDSIISVGSVDLLYLADNGVRSVRARENTDTAYANDIGSAVDSIVIDHMAAAGDYKYLAKAAIEPVDGRYWLAIKDKIFVLSAFQGSNISAWSVYEPLGEGETIDEMVSREDKVYLRTGNRVLVYGGTDGETYDDCEVVVELPYLDANKPATYKEAKGIDATIQGTWQISMGFDHTNPSARDVIATPTQPTFALGKITATGIGTHFGLRLVNEAAGYARLANIIVHYDEMHSKHDAG